MIERSAEVVGVSVTGILVEALRESSCGDCAAKGACATAVIGTVVGRRKVRMELPDAFPVEIGDRVIVGLSERELLRGAGLIYLLPLLALFAAGLLAELLATLAGLDTELPVAIAAVAGLYLGLRVARRRLQSGGCERFTGARLLRPDASYQASAQ